MDRIRMIQTAYNVMRPSFVGDKPIFDENLWFKYRKGGEIEEQAVLKVSVTMVEAMAQFIIHVHEKGFEKRANGTNHGNEHADGAFMESKVKKRKMEASALAQMLKPDKEGEEGGDGGGDVDEGDGEDVTTQKLIMSTLICNVTDRRPIRQKWLETVIQNETHVEGGLMLYGAFTANRDKARGNAQAGAAAMKMIDALEASDLRAPDDGDSSRCGHRTVKEQIVFEADTRRFGRLAVLFIQVNNVMLHNI
jgi:hypothetical protein